MALAGAKIFAAMFVLSVAVNIPIAAKTLAILPQLKCVDNNDVTTTDTRTTTSTQNECRHDANDYSNNKTGQPG